MKCLFINDLKCTKWSKCIVKWANKQKLPLWTWRGIWEPQPWPPTKNLPVNMAKHTLHPFRGAGGPDTRLPVFRFGRFAWRGSWNNQPVSLSTSRCFPKRYQMISRNCVFYRCSTSPSFSQKVAQNLQFQVINHYISTSPSSPNFQ